MEPLKRLRAAVIAQLIREGWRPPPMPTHAAHRLVDDIARLGGDLRGSQPRGSSLTLTLRERRILTDVANGYTVAQIAERSLRSPETIKHQMKRITAKLGARNGTHAVVLAIRQGFIDPEEET